MIEQHQNEEQKSDSFVKRVMHDWDTTVNCALAFIGDKLGLYKAMAQAKDGLISSEELATITRTNERYIRDWLAAQASTGYITYEPKSGKYSFPKDHAAVLADESSPTFMAGGFELVISLLKIESKVTLLFRTGGGLEWSEYDSGVFEGQAKLNSVQYKGNLVSKWIPSLEGVRQKLVSKSGAKVADVGCGYGISTIIMAQAFPNSSFIGFDNHAISIDNARKIADDKQLLQDGRIRFEVASSADFPNNDRYDLITFFDCFHDMANPYAIAKHVRDSLKHDGTVMLVEMASHDTLEENILGPLGANGYAGSVFVCLPNALANNDYISSDPDILPLGGLPGIAKFEKIFKSSGFSKFKCVFKDEFTMILEAKP
jgi:SAM-dependent methyltransferase